MSIRLRIESLDEHGAGIGRIDGRSVHVAGALPGEAVVAHVEHVSRHRATAWAHLIKIERPSSDRVEPPCPHAGDCGGCPWMPLAYPAQLRAKDSRAAAALGSLASTLRPIEPAAEPLGYRETAKYVAVRRQGRTVLGSYAPGTHRVADMDGCLVARKPIPAVARTVAELCDETGVTPRYVVVRFDSAGLGVTLVAWAADERFGKLAAELQRRHPDVTGVSLMLNATKGNALLAGDEIPLLGAGHHPQRFRQANPRQAARLYAALLADAAAGPHATALDLYCGAGAIAEALATLPGCDVTAVDRIPAAPRGARFVCADVGDYLDGAPAADLVVLNPPRSGLTDRVCRALVERRHARLFYVSCLPESFARDAARLAEAYEIVDVRPYDLLPQTPHVELLGRLTRRG